MDSNKFDIGSLLVSRLSSLDLPLYPVMIPMDKLKDGIAAVYRRTGYSSLSTKMGIYSKKVTVEISILSSEYKEGVVMVDKVYNLLQDKNTCNLINTVEEFSEDKFIQTLEFEIEKL